MEVKAIFALHLIYVIIQQNMRENWNVLWFSDLINKTINKLKDEVMEL